LKNRLLREEHAKCSCRSDTQRPAGLKICIDKINLTKFFAYSYRVILREFKAQKSDSENEVLILWTRRAYGAQSVFFEKIKVS